MKRNTMKSVILLMLVACVISASHSEIRVACLGNSITAGSGLDRPASDRYPAVLEQLLGTGFKVGVFARGGMCLQRHAEVSFWYSNHFRDAWKFNPDIVVLLLGTNDSKHYNWESCSTFTADYADLLDTLPLMESHPIVLPILPIHAFSGLGTINRYTIRDSIVPIIRGLSEERSLLYVDAYTPFSQHDEYYTDGIHPNAEGAKVLANLVYDAIKELVAVKVKPYPLHSVSPSGACARSRVSILVSNKSHTPPYETSLFDCRGRMVKELEGRVPIIVRGRP